MKRKTHLLSVAALIALAQCGCTGMQRASQTADAVAVLGPTQGNAAHGTVYFTRVKDGVRIDGEITGLKPGSHGFHMHEKGDCSAADAMSAGGHYNPSKMPHGSPSLTQRHMGDFGNIEANASGVTKFSRIDQTATLDGLNSVIGHAVVVHADPDDLKSQPASNAGKRVACGVIGKKS